MDGIKNVALISAAGSGKTHALTKRFLYLFLNKRNYPLESLYAITFTNAAAYEMKSRIIRYLEVLATFKAEKPQEIDVLNYFREIFSEEELKKIAEQKKKYLLHNLFNLNVSTFHSLFASFLSVIPFEAGILPDYRIIEETEEKLIFQQALEKYFEQVFNDQKSLQAVKDLILLENKTVRNYTDELFENYTSWIQIILNLIKQEDYWKKRLDEYKERVYSSIKKLREFIEENIEATYTNAGKINEHIKKFLVRVDQYLKEKDPEHLEEILEDLVGSRLSKRHFNSFREKLDNPAEFENLIEEANREILPFLEALSNCELIIQYKPIKEIHEIFENEKRKKNVISFSDIENLTYEVLSGLKKNEEVDYLYFKLGCRINHLMIDEFQDTSYKQLDILMPIIDEITAYHPEEKSLFYVGDPHQAIFRWRQGAPELFDQLRESYRDKITEERLDRNYRTKKEIIDFVNKILDKKDEADPNNIGGWLRIEEVDVEGDDAAEVVMSRVVEIIKELKNKGYKESDIAILVRSNKFGKRIAEVLSKHNIPCLSRARASIIDEPDIQFLLKLLKFLDNPEDDFSLFHILTSDVFNVSEQTINKIKRKNKTLYLTLADHCPGWDATKKLKELLSVVYFMNPYQLIFHICKTLKIEITHPIASFLDAVTGYISDGCGSLNDFINWLEKYGETIESKEIQFEGVRITTIHKAKGLEFEVVILPETYQSGNRNKRLIFAYSEKSKPEKILLRKYGKYFTGIVERERELSEIDDLNLLYVALTRAKSGVWMLENKKKSSFWYKVIKEKLGDTPLPFSEIPRWQAPVKREEEKVYAVSPVVPSLAREEREIYSPTERGVEIIEPARRAGMKFGDIVHKALSKVEWLDDSEINTFVDEIVRYVKNNSARTLQEQEEVDKRLKPLLLDIFTDPDLRFAFYREKRDIIYKNELPVYFEDGKRDVSIHIDRILIEPEKITVIDFKTGTEKPEYTHQMKVYKKGVEAIYPGKKINTILVYLEKPRGSRIEVVE
ncbi:MAG: UvrD-helicase domain-containing protein [candidate division WOR-3 bacterium]|nr:UvrD-helicase domain-containing protein [candidate division WOR-3 bacterium]